MLRPFLRLNKCDFLFFKHFNNEYIYFFPDGYLTGSSSTSIVPKNEEKTTSLHSEKTVNAEKYENEYSNTVPNRTDISIRNKRFLWNPLNFDFFGVMTTASKFISPDLYNPTLVAQQFAKFVLSNIGGAHAYAFFEVLKEIMGHRALIYARNQMCPMLSKDLYT